MPHPWETTGNGTHKVIIRFVSRKTKMNVMRDAKQLKGTKININEHLTRKNAGIAKTARDLKKKGKIEATWTRDCKIFIKVNGKTQQVRDVTELYQFSARLPESRLD